MKRLSLRNLIALFIGAAVITFYVVFTTTKSMITSTSKVYPTSQVYPTSPHHLATTFDDDVHPKNRSPFTERPCPANTNREQLKALLRLWHSIAKRRGIEYVIAMGSLLGQYRNNDAIPWDEDVDVLVDVSYYNVLKRSAQGRNFKQGEDREFHLVVHPEFETKLQEERHRWNCEGKKVPEQEDSCSFVQPLGRLINGFRHLDIFHFTRVGKLLDVPDIGKQYDRADFYPFVRCKFMNILTWCPNNSRNVLEKRYGSLKDELVCEDGEWKRRSR